MSQLKELLDRHGIRPKKSLGQHFVTDPNTIARIIRLAEISPKDHVLEVGAGCGALTLALAGVAGKVTAMETDSRLLPVLEEVLNGRLNDVSQNIGAEGQNVEIVLKDVLEADLSDFGVEKMVSNLPYNISARLIIKILESYPAISEMTVMVQREVAERFLAQPGGSNFGLISLKAGFFSDIKDGGKVSPSVFYPKPKVFSKLLRFVRRPDTIDALGTTTHITKAFNLAKMAFSKRRKMLHNSLAGSVEPKHFDSANVPSTARPQELSFNDWQSLALALSNP